MSRANWRAEGQAAGSVGRAVYKSVWARCPRGQPLAPAVSLRCDSVGKNRQRCFDIFDRRSRQSGGRPV